MKRLLAAVLLATLCACEQRPAKGLVTAKRFEAAHTDMVMMPLIIYNGKSTTTILMPYWFHYPDRWILTIEPYDDSGRPLPTRTVQITREAFEATDKGKWFEETDANTDHEKVRKERKQ